MLEFLPAMIKNLLTTPPKIMAHSAINVINHNCCAEREEGRAFGGRWGGRMRQRQKMMMEKGLSLDL